jgi:hypothetical protein
MLSETNGYEILVKGHLDDKWNPWFEGFTVSRCFSPDDVPVTQISGTVADQAALHGILTKLRDIGITILSVNPIHFKEGKEK